VPLDESPNLISLLGAVQAAMIAGLYDRLEAAGFEGLTPSSAAIF